MGFYDAKGYWRSEGEGFYDTKGYWVEPGGSFYDGLGYLRNPGDSFYDTKGNLVRPGEAFFDGRGYLQYPPGTIGTGSRLSMGCLFLLALPVILLWMVTDVLSQWIVSHLYLFFFGYLVLDAVICGVITRVKKNRGFRAVLSFAGNYTGMLSFIYITLIYAIPYVTNHNGSLGGLLEFAVVLAVGCAIVMNLQFFNYYHENAVLELFLGVLLFAATILVLKHYSYEVSTIQEFAAAYGVRPSGICKLLFGFAL